MSRFVILGCGKVIASEEQQEALFLFSAELEVMRVRGRNPHYDKRKHRAWSEKVRRRAGGLCEECRRYGRKDENGLPPAAQIAHHIKPVEFFPELAYDVRNGQALCKKCHAQKHPEKGGKHR